MNREYILKKPLSKCNKILIHYPTMILAMIGFMIPLYVRGIIMEQSDIEMVAFLRPNSPFVIDLFSASKFKMLTFLIILLGIHFLFLFLTRHISIQLPKAMLFVVLFYGIILISTFYSEHKHVAKMGFTERYEGMHTYTYYILLIVLTYFLARKWKDIALIYQGLLFGMIPIVIIGILQANDIFPIISKVAEPFMFGLNDASFDGQIQSFLVKHREDFREGFNFITTTLYNQNYVGVYATTIFFVGLGLQSIVAQRFKKSFYQILVGLSFLLLLLSGSKAGFYVWIVGFSLFFLLEVCEKKKQGFISMLTITLLCSIVFFSLNTLTHGAIYRKFFHVPTRSLVIQDQENTSISIANENPIISIDVLGDQTIIRDSIEEAILVNEDGIPLVQNKEKVDSSVWKFGYHGDILIVKHNGKKAYFKALSDGKVGVFGPRGVIEYVPEPKDLLLNGYLFSSRGIIWSRAIELIKERPLLGYGADTFAIYHPYDDVINSMNFSRETVAIAINPHSMYLLLGVNFGIFGLLVFLSFMVYIFMKGAYVYWKHKKARSLIKMTLFPLLAFLTMALTNDTMISIGVVLYLLIGVAFFGVNYFDSKKC